MIKIYLGYDAREALAAEVLSYSIRSRASKAVDISLLKINDLEDIYSRPRDLHQQMDFTYTRFLVPYLSGYEGWSLYLDCDMLNLEDIARLWALRNENFSVMTVKHPYYSHNVKTIFGEQDHYPMKYWSSLMLFNNSKCRALTPQYINSASRLDLHQFKWLSGEREIGTLPRRWNHLVGLDHPNRLASMAHFTLGIPFFEAYRDCEFSEEWFREKQKMAGKRDFHQTFSEIFGK